MRVLGIDPSYKQTGFAVIENKELIYSTSLDLKDVKNKKEKREWVKNTLGRIETRFFPDKIVIERTRLFSRGIISAKTIIALASLIVAVIDASDLDVYSVDSRSFKAKVIGNAS